MRKFLLSAAIITACACAQDGNFYVYEGRIGADGILSQTFVDTPGQTLLISGWLAGDGTSPSDFNMSFNGVTRVSVNPVPAQGYKQYAFTATATGLDTFSVGFANDPSFDAIDNFSVTPGIPELATWAMMIIGFGGVALQLRHRWQAASPIA